MVDVDVIISIIVTALTGVCTILNAIAARMSQSAGNRSQETIKTLESAANSVRGSE